MTDSSDIYKEFRQTMRLLWRERGVIDGGSGLLNSPMGLAGHSVCRRGRR